MTSAGCIAAICVAILTWRSKIGTHLKVGTAALSADAGASAIDLVELDIIGAGEQQIAASIIANASLR